MDSAAETPRCFLCLGSLPSCIIPHVNHALPDEAATRACDEQRIKDRSKVAAEQRPSMGQDMQKGRRTEIEFLNGYVVREGEKLGMACRANAVLTDIVNKVERGELQPDPGHITELRLN